MTSATLTYPDLAAPAWTLLGAEPMRAALEYASLFFLRTTDLPQGDGHPVIIFPGLASDRRAIRPLKSFCEKLGYCAYDWGRGFNAGPHGDLGEWFQALAREVDALAASHTQSISLVGWSLGGIYAREVAKLLEHPVRQVVSIGAPFAGSAAQTNASFVYRLVNGSEPDVDFAMAERLATPPEAPTTSIYSRSDGVVAWQACIQTGNAAQVENVEVSGSHCGLGWNPAVLTILADRLNQPEGAWQPYLA